MVANNYTFSPPALTQIEYRLSSDGVSWSGPTTLITAGTGELVLTPALEVTGGAVRIHYGYDKGDGSHYVLHQDFCMDRFTPGCPTQASCCDGT
jgi:hypothetical protein